MVVSIFQWCSGIDDTMGIEQGRVKADGTGHGAVISAGADRGIVLDFTITQ
jgi:hypothetical protein